MQAAAIFTPYFRQKRNIFYFFGILNAEKKERIGKIWKEIGY